MDKNNILTEKDMPKEVLEQIARQEEIQAEVRRVYHDGISAIILECFHDGKAIGNVGLTVEGNAFSYRGPLGPLPRPVKVFGEHK